MGSSNGVASALVVFYFVVTMLILYLLECSLRGSGRRRQHPSRAHRDCCSLCEADLESGTDSILAVSVDTLDPIMILHEVYRTMTPAREAHFLHPVDSQASTPMEEFPSCVYH